MTTLSYKYAAFGAMVTLAAMDPGAAFATTSGGLTPVSTSTYSGTQGGFSTIFERVAVSFGGLPGLISMFAYLMGIVFAIAGVLKVKEHVEAPDKTDLKSGAMRLIAGGALFALPFVMETMTATIGDQDASVGAAKLKAAAFDVQK